jgi:sulfatase modifying factor 1
VTLTRAFELAQFETSQAEWTAVGFQNPSRVETFGTGDCLDPDCPVGHTTWFEAVAYANRKSELAGLAPCYTLASCTGAPGTGMGCDSVTLNAPSVYDCAGYRLPTEAEWEYAARAGTRTAFYTGPVRAPAPTHENPCPLDPNLESIAWYCHNSGGFTHKRGQLNPNAWGLYDTLGNEEEWVHDRFNGLGYGVGPFVDPHGGLEIDGTQYVRVTRGGIFIDGPTALRVANRAFSYIPTTVGPGLRLARTLFDAMK